MLEPIETGRETQWFHTRDVEGDTTCYPSEADAIEAAIDRLAKHVVGIELPVTEGQAIDWQLYRRDVIHEVIETERGVTTSTTITPLVAGTRVRLSLLPASELD